MDERIYVENEDHFLTLMNKLRLLCSYNFFTELTISTEKEENNIFSVHSMVFNCYSKYFENSKEQTQFNIKVKESEKLIDIFCSFLYNGMCSVNKENSSEFDSLLSELKVYDFKREVDPYKGTSEYILSDHKEKFANQILLLKENNKYCDLSIISNGINFTKFHSFIIAVQSYQLYEFFKNRIDKDRHLVAYVPYTQDIVKKIKEFCYTGKLHMKMTALKNVYNFASFLRIYTLCNKLEEILKTMNLKIVPPLKDKIEIVKPPKISHICIKNLLKQFEKYFSYIQTANSCFIIHSKLLHTFCSRFREMFGSHDWREEDMLFMTRKHRKKGLEIIIDSIYSGISSEFKWLGLNIDVLKSNQGTPNTVPKEDRSTLAISISETVRKKRKRNKCTSSFRKLFCFICNKSYNQKKSLENHLMKVHNQAAKYFCEYCTLQFFDKAEFEFHLIKKHNFKTSSNERNQDLQSQKKLRENFQDNVKPTLDQGDFNVSDTPDNYLVSLKYKVDKGKETIFSCFICQRTFYNIDLFNSHFESHRAGGSIFSTDCQLQNNSQIYSDRELKPFFEDKVTLKKLPQDILNKELNLLDLKMSTAEILQDYCHPEAACIICGKIFNSEIIFDHQDACMIEQVNKLVTTCGT